MSGTPPAVYMVPLDRFDDFIASPSKYASRRGGDAADDLDQTYLRNPRGTQSVRGIYPQLPGLSALSLYETAILYRRTPEGKAIVDIVAEDMWNEWFKVIDPNLDDDDPEAESALVEAFEAFCKNPTGKPMGRPLWWYCENATKKARRDGRALLYFMLSDASGDVGVEPSGKVTLANIHVIPQANIKGYDKGTDPTDPDTYNEPTLWKLRIGETDFNVHASRVVPFVPWPMDDDAWNGISELEPGYADLNADLNLKWAAAESAYQRAAPILTVKATEPITSFDDTKKAAIKAEVKKIQDGITQRIFLDGIEVDVLEWGQGVFNPMPYHDIFTQGIATSARIPRRVITGDEAGALAASNADTMRYFGRIGKGQEGFADPIVRTIFSRAQDWGLLPTGSFDIEWNPLVEQDAEKDARTKLTLATARDKYRQGRMPLAKDLEYDTSEQFQQLEPLPAPQPFGGSPFGGPPGQPREGEDRKRGADSDQLAVHPRLRSTVRRLTARFLDALAKYEDELASRIGADKRAGDADTPPDQEAIRLLLQWNADPDVLAGLVEEALIESANQGGPVTWSTLGKEGTFRLIKNDPRSPTVFRSVAQRVAAGSAQDVTDRVRRSVAEAISKGEGIQAIRQRVRDSFDVVEYKARQIAQTEATRGYNLGAKEAMRQAGVNRFKFIALPGADQVCEAEDGRTYALDDLAHTPPLHPNCRCATAPVFEDQR